MVKDTFWYDGISAASMGITLREPLMVGGAIPRVERISIPGRNGDVLYHDGSFENRPATASCFALKPRNVMQDVTRVNNWLLSSYGYKELVIPEDRDHFFMAAVENGAEISTKLHMLAPFTIEFTCKPERFLLTGKETIVVSWESSEHNILNPTAFESKPLVKIYGNGTVGFSINGNVTMFRNVEDYVYYDCATHSAWKDGKSCNNDAYGTNLENRKFVPGLNSINTAVSATKI